MIRALMRAQLPDPETRYLLGLLLPKPLRRPGRILIAGVVLLLVSLTVLLLAPIAAADPPANPCTARGSLGGNNCIDNNPALVERKKKQEAEEAAKTPEEKFEDRVEEYKEKQALSKGVLGAFKVTDRDGSPISIYQVHADTGDWKAWDLKARHFIVEFLFQLNLWLVAFACWLVAWALSFSLAALLLKPVLAVSNSLHSNLLLYMGLPSLFLTFALVVAAWHWMFGVKARGWGEAVAALLISALAATTLSSPASLILDEQDGALGKARELSAHVGALILDGIEGPSEKSPAEEAAAEKDYMRNGPSAPVKLTDLPQEISRPITNALVDAFVTKPAMLLSYGQVWSGGCEKEFRDARARQAVWEDMLKEERSKQDGAVNRWLNDQLKKIPGIGGWLSDNQTKKMDAWRKAMGTDITQQDAWKELFAVGPIDGFEKSCVQGSAKAAKEPTPEKLGGALFLLIASLLTMAFVIVTVFGYLNAQFWLAVEAALARFALAVGVLPGPGRAWLWGRAAAIGKWLALLVLSIAALALFIVIVVALVTAGEDEIPGGIVVRFIVIDAAAIAMFTFRRKIASTAGQVASRARARMGNSNFGGQTMTSPAESLGGRSFGAAGAAWMLASRGRGGAMVGGMPAAGGFAGRGAGPGGRRAGAVRSTLRAGAATGGVMVTGAGIVGRAAAAGVRAGGTAQGRAAVGQALSRARAKAGLGMPGHVPANAEQLRERIAQMRAARTRPPGQPAASGRGGARRPSGGGAGTGPAARGHRRTPASPTRSGPGGRTRPARTAATPTPTPPPASTPAPGVGAVGAHARLHDRARRVAARRAAQTSIINGQGGDSQSRRPGPRRRRNDP
ncbi:hypothetical protein [Streptomyces alkaliterrae]|uniref:Uncharacterized protein n=1 Tax=Streptomyces alkaliterrae TaxID=2213162 RepID=A0A5P0YSC6_9ACTN|nr:hypothetical protein [Streptomyces alkaliterrae]MBB1260924.1 hypothetical protein [Streptomyces alkaliterrae]MQS03233.1 hypothetical protein [Streptomyces alkaliterrae]